mmetsp:Transcript_107302/g.256197  ORF Transcript_107302/g.256197 Transcript_107302/m.256197 type:complete len:335 (-) Transcript_107302:918-1922(-)
MRCETCTFASKESWRHRLVRSPSTPPYWHAGCASHRACLRILPGFGGFGLPPPTSPRRLLVLVGIEDRAETVKLREGQIGRGLGTCHGLRPSQRTRMGFGPRDSVALRCVLCFHKLLHCFGESLLRDCVSLRHALHYGLGRIQWILHFLLRFKLFCLVSPGRPVQSLHAEPMPEGIQQDHSSDRHDADVQPCCQENEILTIRAVRQPTEEVPSYGDLTQSALDRCARQDRHKAERDVLHHRGSLKWMTWQVQDENAIDGKVDAHESCCQPAGHQWKHMMPECWKDIQCCSATYHAEKEQLPKDPDTAHHSFHLVKVRFGSHSREEDAGHDDHQL